MGSLMGKGYHFLGHLEIPLIFNPTFKAINPTFKAINPTFKAPFPTCAMVKQKSRLFGDGNNPTFKNRNPYKGYIKSYYGVEFPIPYDMEISWELIDPIAHMNDEGTAGELFGHQILGLFSGHVIPTCWVYHGDRFCPLRIGLYPLQMAFSWLIKRVTIYLLTGMILQVGKRKSNGTSQKTFEHATQQVIVEKILLH